ncbi:hypothetical protein [Streptomyces sp. CB03911]|uniref:hypothetical protein n=1 Tax=Streptomyces sp. CB03911 TaxID=1804758 RepID=UPI000964682F|nr:hypothetical protein [Streptomyces sp. CB03911]OKI12714.1 hypothetical protein A6A07_17790 [Streptomyces sp. CB03911]
MRRRLGRRQGAFDLGRLELPVAICALVWTLVSLFVLVAPTEAHTSVVIVVGLLVMGGLFFFVTWRSDPESLETEPGDVDAFRH